MRNQSLRREEYGYHVEAHDMLEKADVHFRKGLNLN